VHQEFYVVVVQEGGGNPRPAQGFGETAFLIWAAKLKQKSGAEFAAGKQTQRARGRGSASETPSIHYSLPTNNELKPTHIRIYA
jgi:hypothetical protein